MLTRLLQILCACGDGFGARFDVGRPSPCLARALRISLRAGRVILIKSVGHALVPASPVFLGQRGSRVWERGGDGENRCGKAPPVCLRTFTAHASTGAA